MDFTKLTKNIDEYCEKEKIMGVLRVTVHDKIVYEKHIGYADIETGREFDDKSVFTFYSISKPFCILGLMKLVDAGLVDLDAHPSLYVPETAWFDKRLTLRMMFHHTSGLPELQEIPEYNALGVADKYLRVREYMARLKERPMHFEPGTQGEYVNTNILVAALIIENVSGLPYAKYMEKEVFAPLNMEHAAVDNPSMYVPNRVSGYNLDEDGNLVKAVKSAGSMFGAGDIVGTADDLYRLNHAIKHKLLVSEKSWEAILTPSPLNKMGLGCTVVDWHGMYRIQHNGGSSGFRTLHIQLPNDDFDVIFLSNCGFGNARADILEMLHEAFYGDGTPIGEIVEMDKGYI